MSQLIKEIKGKKNIIKIDLLIIFIFLLVAIMFAVWQPEASINPVLEHIVEKYGRLGPVVVIGIAILEVVIAPIPGAIMPIIGGAIYGFWLGALYTWIGNVIGSTIAFFLARFLGRPLVKKIVGSEEKIAGYDSFLKRNKMLIWLVYIIPAFPVDIISFVIGFSQIRFKRFIKIVAIGFIPNLLILSFFGRKLLLSSGTTRLIYLLLVALIMISAFTIKKLFFEQNK